MDKIIDDIVFMIFDNNIINNPDDTKIFFNKLYTKLKMNEFDSINIEESDSESESDDDEDDSELVVEELKIIVKNDFSELN